ncbi:MAG: asparagine synthase (glutamine-hydrolyzing) [Flavobacteriales bacterium]|nr:asparagine synthase (glutamine-hydrolyzing) [Flavobacteriales bacterium]
MCGIAGYIGKEKLDEACINAALQTMEKRGPDANGHSTHVFGDSQVNLLHSRLSIIDLDPRSNQPFHFEHIHLAFNGEIYNYVELKEELITLGHAFQTDSDTEVLVKAYLEWGDRCTERFEGMWAFALLDDKLGRLMLSRDRFAEKPFYLHETNDGVYFASEVKALKALGNRPFEVNSDHILRYIVNGHKSLYKTNETFFHGVRELPLSHNGFVSVNNPGEVKESPYWIPKLNEQKMSMEEAIEGTRERLINSVKLRMRSDVPLAFCLSGGVDSASLVSIAAKEFNVTAHTFSIIDNDHRYDEYENIQATIEDTGCESTKVILDPNEDNISRLESLVQYHDAPVATISYFVHSFLSEQIAKNGFKISISGTAADELFTGYYDHFVLHMYEMRNHPEFARFKAEWEKYPLQFVRHPDFRKFDLYFDNPDKRDHIYLNNELFRSQLNKDFHEPFSETKYCDRLLRNRMMNELFNEVVRVILHEDDLNSMKYSLENRSPFLDKGLFEWAYSIPSELLINEGYNKYILRSSMKGILNDQVRLSREKKGFNASINSIFDFKNPEHRAYFLDDSAIYQYFDRSKMEEMLNKEEYPNSYKKFLFNFINAKIFLEQHN